MASCVCVIPKLEFQSSGQYFFAWLLPFFWLRHDPALLYYVRFWLQEHFPALRVALFWGANARWFFRLGFWLFPEFRGADGLFFKTQNSFGVRRFFFHAWNGFAFLQKTIFFIFLPLGLRLFSFMIKIISRTLVLIKVLLN